VVTHFVRQVERELHGLAVPPGVTIMLLDVPAAVSQAGEKVSLAPQKSSVALQDSRHGTARPACQVRQPGELSVCLKDAQAERLADDVQLADVDVEILALLDEAVDGVAEVALGGRRQFEAAAQLS